MMYKIGSVNRLKVVRKTDIGYILDGNGYEIFLHNNETNYKELGKGDYVNAFLYFDNKGRLAATLYRPLITVEKPAVLEVKDVLEDLGVFLNMGISKDLLLSVDDLPRERDLWPNIGDKLFVKLDTKKNRLVAKLINPKDIIMKNELEIDSEKEFFVQFIGKAGINLFNNDHDLVFVHNTHYRGNHHLGELVTAKILNKSENGYTASLIKQKEDQRLDDATIILNMLKKYNKLPLTAKSSSEEINKYFDMSRKAFKRALGLLYKQRKVKFEEDKTILMSGDDFYE